MKRSFSSFKSIIIILALTLIPFTVLVLVPNEYRLRLQVFNLSTQLHDSVGRNSGRLSRFFLKSVRASAVEPDLRLLIGVITCPEYHLRRHLVRHVYALQQSSLDHAGGSVDVRFFLCNLTREADRVLLALEIKLYGDIVILNCTENLNDGKTYAYFSSLPSLFDSGRPYDFVIKADDDAFFKLDNLVEEVRKLPREDVYAGAYVPCSEYRKATLGGFFAGYGYMLSWDLVEWIAESEIPRSRHAGLEDRLMGQWLRDGNRGKNKYGMGLKMYDYLEDPGTAECKRHEFTPETIAVHQLKSEWRWVKTIEYFNLTKGLKPSKLYSVAYPETI